MDLKKIVKHFLFVIILLGSYSIALSQDTTGLINFRVVDETTGVPVPMAHIINKTHRDAAIADMLGYFKIAVAVGDTISISSLGYFSMIIYSWGQFSKDSLYFTIKLKPRHYELKEVKFTWFSNYEKFLKGVKELRLPVTKEEIDIERINSYFKRSVNKLNLMDLPKATAGFSFGKDWLRKQNEKLAEQLKKERIQRLIERKYSSTIVEILTGLKGYEVFWFMEYCAFTEEYLITASDYEIRMAIIEKFRIYNQDKAKTEIK